MELLQLLPVLILDFGLNYWLYLVTELLSFLVNCFLVHFLQILELLLENSALLLFILKAVLCLKLRFLSSQKFYFDFCLLLLSAHGHISVFMNLKLHLVSFSLLGV